MVDRVSAPRWGGKRDANQSNLLETANEIPGVVAIDLGAVGAGVPDALFGYQGVNYLAEIKLVPVPGVVKPSDSKLNPRQVIWHDVWPGQVIVVRTIDDVLRMLGIIE